MTLKMVSLGETESVLIVGADGAIGKSLVMAYEAAVQSVWQTTRHRNRVSERRLFLDLSEDVSDWPLPPEAISTAILCAAVTSMERCRVEPETSRRVNVVGTVALAERLVDAGAFVIFLSTNAVFDGETPFAKPTDLTNPQTEYGRQKVEVEERLLKFGDRVAVVRFSKVIPPDMPLFTNWATNLRAGKVIHPFSDMVMAPISLAFAVEALRQVAQRQLPGITQASAAEDITYANATQYISQKLCADDKLVEPISYREVGITFSPTHTTLDSTKMAEFGLNPPPPTNALDQFHLRIL
jgi:dTDP-4-dehydrorhamnose reductase